MIVALCKDGIAKNHSVHRLVAEHFIRKPASDTKLQVDHIDNDKLNNVVSNLRWVSCQQNIWNKKKTRKASSSKYIGVCFNSRDHIWQASIKHMDRTIYLGVFRKEKDAASAYNVKAYELRGAFAVLNDISDDED